MNLSSILWQVRMKVGNPNQLLFSSLLQRHRYPEILQKIVQLLCCCLEIVLVNRMTHVMNDTNLKFTLHLGNSKLLIHSFLFSSQENLWNMHVQKDLREPFEPSHPIFFSLLQVYLPSPIFMPVLLDFSQLSRERYSCGLEFSDCTGVVAPFYACVQRIEVFRSVGYDLVHERQSFNSSAFDHIDDYTSDDTLNFFNVSKGVHDPASNRTAQGMTDHDYVFIRVSLHDFFQSLDSFCIESLYRKVIIPYFFFGKAMTFEIVGNQRTEVFDFFCQSSEAQGGMTSTMDAEEESTFFSGSQN